MKIVVQRVTNAKVDVEGKTVGKIDQGVLVLIGAVHGDTDAEAVWLAQKLAHLRIFEDEQGKMNKSLIDMQGEALVVSQFTLYADCSTGRRPSFTQAAKPEIAEGLCQKFIQELTKSGIKVQSGIFGAYMQVSLLNDGPVTLILERTSTL